MVWAFTREACELGRQGIWTVDRICSEAEEFLGNFILEAYASQGHDRYGRKLPKVTNHWGRVEPEVEQSFGATDAWGEYEAELLALSEAIAAKEPEPKEPNTGECPLTWDDVELSSMSEDSGGSQDGNPQL